MAGSTAPTAVDQASAGPTWRGLWQAPAFVLGVAALTAVVLMRPLLASGDAAAPLKRDLAEARRLLEHPGGDPEQAAKLAQRVLDAKDRRPELAGQADLLLGTARMKQALNAEGDRAAELWAEARQCLEDAQKETVPEGDKGRLQLRLGVVGFYTHDDLNHVIALITPAVEESDDAVLGYTVLTQAYLQLPTPNVATALKLNLALRNRPEATEEVLAPARLLGGELELKLNKPEEARRVLENLGPKATPEMKAKALRLCARSYQGEGNWPEAAARWDKALADDKANGEALYNLGLCAQHQGQGADAAHDWEQCVQAGGDEGRTAALALADMRLKGPNPETALEMFAKVVDGVKPGDDWPGRLTDRASVVKLFQDAGKAYLDNHQFDAAVRLADSFAAVAGPGEAEVLRGKASAAWARFCREQAKQGPAAGQAGAEAQARQLFLKAAAAYAAAAERAPNDPVPGEYLWQSARCSWEARDLPQASARLEQVTKYAPTPEEIKQDWYVQRMGEACYLLGETRRALHDGDGAAEAYRQCITKQTLFAYRARYRLAMAAMAAGKLDDARDGLEYTLKLLHTADRDAEAEEQTLFALGEIYYRSGKYQQVVEKLGAAVERFPTNPEGTRAHYYLADSYRRLADQKMAEANPADATVSSASRDQALKLHRMYLTTAAKEFLELAVLMDKPEGQDLLKLEERIQVPFLAADCLFDLGKYDDARNAYQVLAERFGPDRLERLNALGGLVRCYAAVGDTAAVQKRLKEIDAMLPQMPKPVQDQWSQWLTVARKPVGAP